MPRPKNKINYIKISCCIYLNYLVLPETVTLISNCRIYQGDAYLPLNHSWHHGDIIGY